MEEDNNNMGEEKHRRLTINVSLTIGVGSCPMHGRQLEHFVVLFVLSGHDRILRTNKIEGAT